MRLKKILASVLTTVMLAACVPITSVYAAEPSETEQGAQIAEKNINLYTSAIDAADAENNKWDYIYCGTYGADKVPIKWRVLSKTGNGGSYLDDSDNVVEGDKAMFVILENAVLMGAYDDSATDWQTSNAKLLSEQFKADAFSASESALVLKTTKSEGAMNLFHTGWKSNVLTDAQMFYISAYEANEYLGSVNQSEGLKAFDFDGKGVNWGLRSAITQTDGYIGAVTVDGTVMSNTVDTVNIATRPAFNLNLDDVLFTSNTKVGKLQEEYFSGRIYKNADVTDEEGCYRLTLKDESRGFAVQDTTARTASQGGSLTFQCTDAMVGDNEYISAMIVNSDDEVLYYGQLRRVLRNNANEMRATLKIPDDIVGGDYTLKLFNEQLNDKNGTENTKYITDLSSDFVDIPLKVEGFYGQGTASKPYLIRSLADLEYLSRSVNQGNTYADKYLKLTQDIDMSEKYNQKTGLSWGQIATGSNTFKGVLDGDGHKIVGMYICNDGTRHGLFANLSGTVRNLGIIGEYTSIKTEGGFIWYNGGIAAVIEDTGRIEYCWTDTQINGSENCSGGIAGYSNGVIENCYTLGDVNGTSYVGGIVGSNHGVVRNCFAFGGITGTKFIGSVIGSNSNYATCENVYYIKDKGVGTGTAVSVDSFENGEVAYLLQSGVSEDKGLVWGQNLKDGEKDSLPVFINKMSSNDANARRVYMTTLMVDNKEFTSLYSNNEYTKHMIETPIKRGTVFTGWYENDGRETGNWGWRFDTENWRLYYLYPYMYGRMAPAVKFDVSDTEHVYKKDTKQGISLTPICSSVNLTADDFTVKYYAVDGNANTLKSAADVSPILSGEYLYVIDFKNTRYDCGIEKKYAVTDEFVNEALPNTDSYDNIGYMHIYENQLSQDSIIFNENQISIWIDEEKTNTLINNNEGSAVEYTSSNTAVAVVDENGKVTGKSAGAATITAACKKANSATVYASYTVTVNKIPIEINAGNCQIKYGDNYMGGVTYVGNGTDVDKTKLNGRLIYKTDYVPGKGVGDYILTPYGQTSDYYDITYGSGTITVDKKVLNQNDFEISAADKTYDGTNSANISASVKGDAVVGSDRLTVEIEGEYLYETANNADNYIEYTIKGLSGQGAENYTVVQNPMGELITGELSAQINPAEVTFFVSEETTRKYDGSVHSVDVSATAIGKAFSKDNYTVYYKKGGDITTEPKDPGEYEVIIELNDGAADIENFVAVQPSAKLVIALDASEYLYITGSNKNATVDDVFNLYAYYGNRMPYVTWQSSDESVATVDQNGEVKVLKSGETTITAAANDVNYGTAEFKLSASKRRIAVSASASELVKNYNGHAQYIAFTSSEVDLEEKNVRVATSYVLNTDVTVTEPKNAGTYTVSYEVDDERYSGSGTVTYTINKAYVTVAAKDISKEYGEEPHYELDVVTGGDCVNLEEIKASARFESEGAAKTAAVGVYDIVLALDMLNTDNIVFNISETCGTLTVTKAQLTVRVKDVSREWGAENPKAEAELLGFKNGETKEVLDGELTFAYGDDIVGDAPIGFYENAVSASGLSADNYDIVYEYGDVTVTKIKALASGGAARSTFLTVVFDKPIPGLTAECFAVRKNGAETAISEISVSFDNRIYTISGTFENSATYSVEITFVSDFYEIDGSPLSVTVTQPSGGSGGGGGGGGGASVPTIYTVSFETNGANKINSVSVTKNGKLSEPQSPVKDGYVFAGWYTDKQLTERFDFNTKITESLVLYAKWTEDKTQNPTDTEWKNPFADVKKEAWFFENVMFASQNGLMSGVSDTEFAPNDTLTRGMLVTILYRAEGEPNVGEAIPFVDVTANDYWAKAVCWAAHSGIVFGVSEEYFAPEENITREQFAAIMYRYAAFKENAPSGAWAIRLDYRDVADISDYAVEGVMYCTLNGIMQGKENNCFAPTDNATRAEAAAILQRFIQLNK